MKINDNSKSSMKYLLTALLALLAAQAAAALTPSDSKPPEPARNITETLISTNGIEADAVIDIGKNGSTLKIVNGGVKLPDGGSERSN
jgi:hypothetical protein